MKMYSFAFPSRAHTLTFGFRFARSGKPKQTESKCVGRGGRQPVFNAPWSRNAPVYASFFLPPLHHNITTLHI
ncbi:hypothetical protein A2673_00780 [Candidatus Kaiserbacteria bacterium RIFCSPHIGHO2_01_FULL_50_13]|uniref:Uncharacterized protein n=1 Tax=Candidatus Kaiserbacteria bacterium RIFCSPLOWO2_01_FULL_50_24 TaxID=1798507 RepID=A0A1F6EMY4_9BACT|nr:MAG: hypothetical protein A2673_00780 [Candidatus Kaiserbacteria bacterium RIFCSPHIGHO2_01_FULL_50_13]OGG74985.1 MAG: hypothetical protein A3A34_04185 [Candidatus Kaiserbacteria bacterium RIFCSPLOWO2_01_FULL_50_24]OGG81788.1 MAG: hypothetical protein A3H74_01260 [Candidatus Kaiserbacteria bacterium RIFCSPLOWO2_02_FULL_51_13]